MRLRYASRGKSIALREPWRSNVHPGSDFTTCGGKDFRNPVWVLINGGNPRNMLIAFSRWCVWAPKDFRGIVIDIPVIRLKCSLAMRQPHAFHWQSLNELAQAWCRRKENCTPFITIAVLKTKRPDRQHSVNYTRPFSSKRTIISSGACALGVSDQAFSFIFCESIAKNGRMHWNRRCLRYYSSLILKRRQWLFPRPVPLQDPRLKV